MYFRHLEAFWTSMSYNLITVEGCLERAEQMSPYRSIERKAQKSTRPTTRPSCGPSLTLQRLTRPSCGPSCALLKLTRPTTRPSCGPSYMLLKGTRPTTRPSCRPSHGLQLQLGPQLDRVVARVSAQKTAFPSFAPLMPFVGMICDVFGVLYDHWTADVSPFLAYDCPPFD